MLVKQLGLFNIPVNLDTHSLAMMPVWVLANNPAFLTHLFVIVAETTFQLFRWEGAFFLQFTPLLQDITNAVQRTLKRGVQSIEAFQQQLQKETQHLRSHHRTNDIIALLNERKRVCLVSDVIEEKPRDVSASEEQREIDAVSCFTSTPVLSISIVNTLFSSLITTLKLNPVRWERLFYAGPESTVSHLLDAARGVSHTILILSDGFYGICGCYYEQPWRYSSSFYSEGNSLVFRASYDTSSLKSDNWDLSSYLWSRQNSFARVSTEIGIVVGGGGRHALLLDSRLQWGSSGECKSYKCPSLMENSDFVCASLELWRFILCSCLFSNIISNTSIKMIQ